MSPAPHKKAKKKTASASASGAAAKTPQMVMDDVSLLLQRSHRA